MSERSSASAPSAYRRLRPRLSAALRRLGASPAVQAMLGRIAATYLRLTWHTNRLVTEPPDAEARFAPLMPVIVTMWHGQSFLMPFIRPRGAPVRVLVSRHRDGEMIAAALKSLGIGAIRGSGGRGRGLTIEKGGIRGFLEMRTSLESGSTVAMTADNALARRAGLGVVSLARVTGRPIVPVAIATSRRIEARSWDRAVINLPFGRAAIVFGTPIEVPKDADDALLEAKRLQVERILEGATDRAQAIVDRA